MIGSEISQKAFRLLKEYIEYECGIYLGEDKQHQMETRLGQLVREEGCEDFEELYLKARGDETSRLRDRITDALTTNETAWFRDGAPFEAIREAILPALAEELDASPDRKLRVWSTACGPGQEAYSMAMCILEHAREGGGLDPGRVEIFATDISPLDLEKARQARYRGMAIQRGLDPELRKRYFLHDGRYWALKSEPREMVRFEPFNLADDPAGFGSFDLVLCRYVALYYSDEFRRGLYGRLRRALVPGGHLFLGAPETLGAHSTGFEPLEHGKTVYYRVT